MHTLMNLILKDIGHFGSAVADGNAEEVKKQYQLLEQSNLNFTLKISVHDIYCDAMANKWSIAKRDSLLLIAECNNRYKDNYGLVSIRHYDDDDENDDKNYKSASSSYTEYDDEKSSLTANHSSISNHQEA